MFFLKEETKVVSLHPSYFGPNVKEYLINRLNEEEEGRCTGDHFVICVMDMVDIGEGRVIPGSGHAEYTIQYRAIIWKPFRGETVRFQISSHVVLYTDAGFLGGCYRDLRQAYWHFYFGWSAISLHRAEGRYLNLPLKRTLTAHHSSEYSLGY